MKERLMAQKTMAAAMVLAAVALCVMTAMTWSRSREDRQFLLETFESNREMMQQMSRLQEQMLQNSQASQEALKSLATADVSNPEWVRGEVFVHLDSLDGPPGAGVNVHLSPEGRNTGAMGVTASTDSNGRADLGLLRAGRYSLAIRSPGGERVRDSVSAYPGMPFSDVIVMPSAPRMPVNVSVHAEWPEGLDASDVWILVWPSTGRRYLAGREWQIDDSPGSGGSDRALPSAYALSPAGQLYAVRETRVGRNTKYGDIIRWQDEDATAVTTIPLPDREFRFRQISFVVFSQNPGLFESDDVSLVLVPNAHLGPKYQHLTEGPDPVFTIRIPDSVADTVRDFRNEVRRADDAAATDERPT
jgi:5-hydroxyisourate hydrolase-like protein (transthyretin family)